MVEHAEVSEDITFPWLCDLSGLLDLSVPQFSQLSMRSYSINTFPHLVSVHRALHVGASVVS